MFYIYVIIKTVTQYMPQMTKLFNEFQFLSVKHGNSFQLYPSETVSAPYTLSLYYYRRYQDSRAWQWMFKIHRKFLHCMPRRGQQHHIISISDNTLCSKKVTPKFKSL